MSAVGQFHLVNCEASFLLKRAAVAMYNRGLTFLSINLHAFTLGAHQGVFECM